MPGDRTILSWFFVCVLKKTIKALILPDLRVRTRNQGIKKYKESTGSSLPACFSAPDISQ
jgi:hypothetical protein